MEKNFSKEVRVSSDLIEQKVAEGVLDSKGRVYSTGRRKTSVARVWIKKGKGRMIVNGMELTSYLSLPASVFVSTYPLTFVKEKIDVFASVKGGGISGQAGALSHGIARAIVIYIPSLRSVLREKGLLTRDSRMVERKKYGKRKARKSFQFSKR